MAATAAARVSWSRGGTSEASLFGAASPERHSTSLSLQPGGNHAHQWEHCNRHAATMQQLAGSSGLRAEYYCLRRGDTSLLGGRGRTHSKSSGGIFEERGLLPQFPLPPSLPDSLQACASPLDYRP
eukprot:GHVU01208970.1.p2 GENE.GHVU01208970.1~~GHVU01208970.1.p2  ORF type:complete len:126 (+),score=18.65 GHVU01208970.1:388-765(+)